MNKPLFPLNFQRQKAKETIQVDALRFYDTARHTLITDRGESSPLPPSAAKIYEILINNPGYLLSNKEILGRYAHDIEDGGPNESTIKSFIFEIRKAIRTSQWNPIINVHGGYMANMDFRHPRLNERADLGQHSYFDKRNGRIVKKGRPHKQLPRRLRIMFTELVEHPNQTISNTHVAEKIAYDFNEAANTRTAATYVCEIRKILEDLDLPRGIIEAVHGRGHRFIPHNKLP